MPSILNSISKRLFFALGLLTINILIVAVLAVVFLWKARSIHRVTQHIDNQRVAILQLVRGDLDILHYESVNQEFYRSAKRKLGEEREEKWDVITQTHTGLFKVMQDNNFPVDDRFVRIDTLLSQYNESFRLLIQKVTERGFKDFGLEGDMRNFAHLLETTKAIPIADYLTLRRHEKDFLLRKEQRYVLQFNQKADSIRISLATIPLTRKILDQYKRTFNELAELNKEIGLTPTDGLTANLNIKTQQLVSELGLLAELSNVRADEITERVAGTYALITVLALCFSITFTFYTSTRLARPIKRLSNSMKKFALYEDMTEGDLRVHDDTVEIRNLSQTFVDLSLKLKSQFSEIQAQNEEIQAQNEEINSQNAELRKLNDELDRFLYSAAHDLKSPLASLEGLIHLAEREHGQADLAHYFLMMRTSVGKLDSFIRDITAYAQNKGQQIMVEKIELTELLRDMTDALRLHLATDDMDVIIDIDEQDFYSDKVRLGIILKNLVSNSFRYRDPKKKSYVRIEGTITETAASISIIDNGIGIGPEHIDRIFDLFYRANERSTGTGIGLFLVRETITKLGGHISVSSRKGEWTKFELIIPSLKSKFDPGKGARVAYEEYLRTASN